MIKCPFCHFDNEDGALFCERCTSDLTGVPPTPSPAKAAGSPPPIPFAQAEPVIAEAVPYEAIPISPFEAVAAEPVEAIPYDAPLAMPYEAVSAVPPIALEPIPVEPMPAPAAPVTPAPAQAVPVAPPEPKPAPAMPSPSTPAPAASDSGLLPPDAQPRLLVLRGQKRNVEYPIFEGPNFLGRADEKPVDIDLEEQEPPDRVWCSRQHACIHWDVQTNQLVVEDLNSANGTYVNRTRVYPGQKRPLNVNDIIQIGNVQLKVIV